MKLLALDLSLRFVGWASNVALRRVGTSGVFGAEDELGFARLRSLRDDVLALTRHIEPDLVIIEAVFLGLKGATALELAGLGAIVRLALFESALPVVDIAPATLKKFATGKGNALKEQIVNAARTQLGYDGGDHNEADALWLLQAGLSHYNLPGRVELPAKQRDALAVLHWPNPAVRV